MTRSIATAALFVLTAALPAQADQFAVQIDAAYPGASPALMQTLQITEIEALSEGGAYYVILDAPGEAYVETFFNVLGLTALELNALDADWTNPAMAEMPAALRLRFLRAIPCEFCTS
jgi:hypothetical protein